MPTGIAFDALPLARLQRMERAGAQVRACRDALARTGETVVDRLLHRTDNFYEWDHHPAGDAFDPATGSQYYYHAHPQEERPGEHGHFHTFLRACGMPAGVRPAQVHGLVRPRDPDDAPSHLAAVSIDLDGEPVGLFVTNRWVTDEVWYEAADVVRMLDRFRIGINEPCPLVNAWVTAMLALFQPQIARLAHARDAAVAARARARPDRDVFEDRGLEVAADVAIDVDAQIGAVAAALARHRSRGSGSPRARDDGQAGPGVL